ncbi:hypothetical protein DM860_017136 [Cuscuta australis]|uniref:Aminotransferase-like plant mobile domain-containing protein n=1 Tax=Cuscuta australis TaxID=267555 RepID=A0A328DEC7_9ASTE|nr:hypothetical protein DM860_017136 [Cuscuta australis]
MFFNFALDNKNPIVRSKGWPAASLLCCSASSSWMFVGLVVSLAGAILSLLAVGRLLDPLKELVWFWERFPSFLHPNNPISDKSRFARWDDLKMDAKSINFAGEEYLWRPYALETKNSLLLYKEGEGRWVFVTGGGDEVDELICCVRVSELVGIEGVIEHGQYLPHRVAMQFGMDQGHPGLLGLVL